MIESYPVPDTNSHHLISMQLPSQFRSAHDHSQLPDSPDKQRGVRETRANRWALVVDDVSDVTEMLSVLMRHAGYDVSTASSAQEALALARENRFDIVISDIGMPEMNGYQLAQALRTLPGYETVPMVAVTGYSMFDDRSRSLVAGFNEHLTKPIDPRAFLELIEQL
jgi:CheY-like chemotaxis protein